ncbi:uncharacterized protein CDV56_109269 [Aspergillus thermomutatus]|uniref:Xylose isomerase-like TIM barrel domain-containing protein n=1 Tax=Aspergillus thermomutatus TaxID=41047 RepID=A0A397HK63_ASPTH|nr:uncharacterized protein CDV56_109269 [Aspergillus thermomutatus]RHZ63472.1 hypothetical protein CDV56_109269 [Aspergillus thermomutatus]
MTYQPAIMSASLGRAWLHDLSYKIHQAAEAGFKGLEIFYEDLEYEARKLSGTDNPTTTHLLAAAAHIHGMCTTRGIIIIGLQPFLFYEGLKDRTQHAHLLEKMELEIIASDLRLLADLGATQTPAIRFAYEPLCWSTHIDTIEKAWDVVRRVDRPNFGVCLDTFNIAGRVWGDPVTPTGRTENADQELRKTLEWMVREADVESVFYIQVVDAERMRTPLVAGHPFYVDGQPARMSWSRNARTFMYEDEQGGYLPCEEVARAIIQGMGYQGFVSMELFSRTMMEEGSLVPVEHARRGIKAWERPKERLQLRSIVKNKT